MFSRLALTFFFIFAGTAHFIWPEPYLMIMPRMLPWPAGLVAISGAAEIFGGIGVCFPATRRLAGWGLIVLLVAVFRANVQALVTGMTVSSYVIPIWVLWARLPFQIVFCLWVWRVCLTQKSIRRRSKSLTQSGHTFTR